MARLAMLYDSSKCVACRGCQVACKQWWGLEGTTGRNLGSYENPVDRSPNTLTRVKFVEYEAAGGTRWLFLKEGCMHCADAACADVCPTKALKHSATGAVTLQPELCNGCGYCSQFCPFGIPRMDVISPLTGAAKASKCTFCQDRVANGLEPACAKTCPSGAISWGDRESMVAKGNARLAELRAQAGMTQASLYGVDQLGGLGRIYVLTAPPEIYGLPNSPAYPTMAALWQKGLQPLGHFAFGATLLGIAGAFLVARRHIKMEEVE